MRVISVEIGPRLRWHKCEQAFAVLVAQANQGLTIEIGDAELQ